MRTRQAARLISAPPPSNNTLASRETGRGGLGGMVSLRRGRSEIGAGKREYQAHQASSNVGAGTCIIERRVLACHCVSAVRQAERRKHGIAKLPRRPSPLTSAPP